MLLLLHTHELCPDDELKAGLFSAILTAFIVEVYKQLQEDTAATTAQLLRRIALRLDDAPSDQLAAFPKPFSPLTPIVVVNVLWFCGLVISLFTAVLGILAKQWIHAYNKWSEHALPKDTLLLRDFYQEGFIRWRVPEIIGILPALLQAGLLLFVAGLVVYLWTLHATLAAILSALISVLTILAGITIVLPAVCMDCPYKSPLGLLVASFGPGPAFSNWHTRDTSAITENPMDLSTRLSSILNIRPRSLLLMTLQGKNSGASSRLGSRISILIEKNPGMLGVLTRIFADYTKSVTLPGQQSLMRDLHILDHISLRSDKENSANLAASAMELFEKLSVSQHIEWSNWGCLQVIIRIISRHPRDCTPCLYHPLYHLKYNTDSKKLPPVTCFLF